MKLSGFIFIVLAGILISCNTDDGAREVITSNTAHLYTTSRNNGNITRYDINNGERTTYEIASTDSDGIYYETNDDSFTIISRSASRLETYTGINNLEEGESHEISPTLVSPAHFENPWDLAVNGEIYVVSDNIPVEEEEPDVTDPNIDDGDNITDNEEEDTRSTGRFFVYTRSTSTFQLRNVIELDFEVRGIEFIGNDLYAVIYNTNNLVVFENFTSHQTNRKLNPTKQISIEGMLRSMDLDYEQGDMVLTDIGDDNSDSDGAYNIIPDFETKFNATTKEGIMPLSAQLRVSGDNTGLGNPVKIAYDASYNTVFIADAKGKIFGFTDAVISEGNGSPRYSKDLEGASSVYFHTK